MYNPVSTYRIQFNRDFTFSDLLKNIEYISFLGPRTIYASPVFAAAPGSTHGYDVVNPHVFNPEIGSAEEFNSVVRRMKEMGIGWIQDIVPNHMAFHNANMWLMDVLENGRDSEFASFFDIDFDHPDFDGKIFLPFLGNSAEEIIEKGELKLSLKNEKIVFDYFGFWFPVNKKTLIFTLKEEINPEIRKLAHKIEKNDLKHDQLAVILNVFNEDIARLKELLLYQHYKLYDWHEADKHLNYRRFFTISSLISLQMDNNTVFDHYHTFIKHLVDQKKIHGLRLDHIDGLRDPSEYIDRLRILTGDDVYIVVEKILEKDEKLYNQWPLQGSTGYDFLGIVNNLFTCKKNIPVLEKFYRKLTGLKENTSDLIYLSKKEILFHSMQGDLDNLHRIFMEKRFIKPGDDPSVTTETIKLAIGEFLLACPRYKLYSDFFPLSHEDNRLIKEIIRSASKRRPDLIKPLELIQNIFLDPGKEEKDSAMNFFLRCMQFTGPLMAKGIEDTAMYNYNCFIAHNEVGDRLNSYGITINEFHTIMSERQRSKPLSMNATSTHDTKRGEDARARLNVLSELPEQWIKNITIWRAINKPILKFIADKPVPDPNEEYFIYQTLTGIMPFNGQTNDHLLNRITGYLTKSLREAKVHSNWNMPDEEYEKSVCGFVREILTPGSGFLKSFTPFLRKIGDYGIINSLSQVVLKTTCPGIPDFYQGTELWDFSMVDPDNRRPVDYAKHSKILTDLIEKKERNHMDFISQLYLKKENGHIKMWFSHILMKERSDNADLFIHGTYQPLNVSGKYKEHILAFARIHLHKWFITIIPLGTSILQNGDPSAIIDWDDTHLKLPVLAPEKWQSVLNNYQIHCEDTILISEILKDAYPAVIKGEKEISQRQAGVLLHISSLPGNFGTGDLGQESFRFIDLLAEAGQSCWQILPLNPVGKGSSYSPYSTTSAFAGNILLTDPEWLLDARLITEENLDSVKFTRSDRADFIKAEEFRINLLNEAYENFRDHSKKYLTEKFKSFCTTEQYWLDDFALYNCLKREFNEKPWYKWPPKIRNRDAKEIRRYKKKFHYELDRESFYQFIFFLQWKRVKNYATVKGIKIIGDMSFYVSYDSVDVWSNPDVFKLSSDKKMLGIGGAPPDYFSKTGQFWNMPVYNWENIKKDDYSWWKKRILRNIEWFDLVRIDHFRGFSGFWEIPAGEKTAVNGRWVDAPGNDFFSMLKNDIPDLPFIAEDLGEIDDKVYELRDRFDLPGMKVLQFAFNDTLERSIHLPHNYNTNCVVYTGTHDNNTTKGWFENDLSSNIKKQVEEYTGRKLTGKNIQEEFIRLAYSSVSRLVIIPLQDILHSGKNERLNNPSGGKSNWRWKLRSLEKFSDEASSLAKLVKLYWRK